MKIGRHVIVFAILVVLVFSMATTGFAAYYEENETHEIAYQMLTIYEPYETGYKQKFDATSHYLYYSGNAAVYVVSLGASNSSGTDSDNMTYANGQLVSYVTVQAGAERRIKNLVNESGYKFCELVLYRTTTGCMIGGQWHQSCADSTITAAS